MSDPMNLLDIPNATSLPVSADGVSPCASPGGPTTDPSGQAPAPANLSARQAKARGASDERHLWPAFFHLIAQCKPGVVFGEQVEAAINHGWLDLVQADLEGKGYAFGAVGIPAAGVGAPHIRQRLWFVADRYASRRRTGRPSETGNGRDTAREQLAGLCAADELADPMRAGRPERRTIPRSGPVTGSGFWSYADWLPCRDGKARSVEPGTFPLAHGVPARVGRLRGYGNAIVPQVAAEVIKAYLQHYYY